LEAGLTFGAGDVDGYVRGGRSGPRLVDQAATHRRDVRRLDKRRPRPDPLEFNFEGLTLGDAPETTRRAPISGECHCGGATDAVRAPVMRTTGVFMI